MNAWMLAYAAVGLQATVLLAVAGVISHSTIRRAPRLAATSLRTTVLLLAALTVAAACPLPPVWRWDRAAACWRARAAPEETKAATQPASPADAPTSPGDGGVEATPALRSLLRSLARPRLGAGRREAVPASWTNWLGGVVLLGIAVFSARLVWGMRATRRIVRGSRPLAAPQLEALRGELDASFSSPAACEFRESDDVRSAATIGWRRPVVLLASDWRRWSAEELRAVVAHELAHAAQRDCLLSLLAGWLAAVHFYHPLLWRLKQRLALAQELAADQTAAACFASHGDYLLAISRLALRQDGQRAAAGVLSFSSSCTTLLRRIEMLQDKDVGNAGRRRPFTSLLVTAGLVAAAVGASSLRFAGAEDKPSTATSPNVQPETDDAAPGESNQVARPPIDLTYLATDNQGFWAIRPSVAFARDDMRRSLAVIDALANEWFRTKGVPGEVRFSFADIEQASGDILVKRVDHHAAPGKRGEVQFSVGALRTTRPYAWGDLLRPLAPEPMESERHGMRLIQWRESPLPVLGPDLSMAVADDRTLLPAWNAAKIEDWHNAAEARRAGHDAEVSACWRDVQSCVLAFLIDNRTGCWNTTASDSPDELPVVRLLRDCRCAAIGIDAGGEHLMVRIEAACNSDEAAGNLVAFVKRELPRPRDDNRRPAAPGAVSSAVQPPEQVEVDDVALLTVSESVEAHPQPGRRHTRVEMPLLSRCELVEVQQRGRRVHVSARAPWSFHKVASLHLAEMFEVNTVWQR